MILHWYDSSGLRLGEIRPRSLRYSVKLGTQLSALSGFCCLELNGCKLRWWKKGREMK